MQFNKSTYIVLGKNVRKFEFAIVPVYDFSQTVSAYKLLLYSSSSTAQKAAAGFINANFVAENFDSFASSNNGIFP